LRLLTFCSSRLADNAAPAAFCCAFDLAAIVLLWIEWHASSSMRVPHAHSGYVFVSPVVHKRLMTTDNTSRRQA
jgi:hypothetical protein